MISEAHNASLSTIMQPSYSNETWAETQFSACQLGDQRRSKRLVTMMARLANNGGGNLSAAHRGDSAAMEGAYRFIRNRAVTMTAIQSQAFDATAARLNCIERLLAIDDTTTLAYEHCVRDQLGDLGGKANALARGVWVHNTLMMDADRGTTEGLIAQHYWSRDSAKRGKKHQRQAKAVEEKESFKWQHNAQILRARLGGKMRDVIAVSDRESDIFDYLLHKQTHHERYVVRAAQDRVIHDSNERLSEQLNRAVVQGKMTITVSQRGGRKAREAELDLRAIRTEIKAPKQHGSDDVLQVNVVWANEKANRDINENERLSWVLITTESVASIAAIKDVLRCYSLRWRIEDFHKAWKDGAEVEKQQHQDKDTLLRMAQLLAFVAVRLLQLNETLHNPAAAEAKCTEVLSEVEWKTLWLSTEKKPIPDKIPQLQWAYKAIAKMGGFYDTKRTGRASWKTLHTGLTRLDERVSGFNLLRALDAAIA